VGELPDYSKWIPHHAMARSAVLANHSSNGLTTPGLKNVPIPGYANESQDGREGQPTMGIQNLVIHNLVERTAFFEKSVELDNVRILGCGSDCLARSNEMAGIETDRRTVLVRSPVKTEHNHSRLAHSRVGRHGGCFQRKLRRRQNL